MRQRRDPRISPAPGPARTLQVGAAQYTKYELGEDEELSPRELRLAQLAADGLTIQQAAERLGMSFWTAKHHWRLINLKVGRHTQAGVVAVLMRRGRVS
jgi:DNA-binding CsgD family transcriptional regulator